MPPSIVDVSSYLELSIQETGREICIADKRIEFTPKDYPLIHYVYAGQGEFTYGGKTYALKSGDCFFIPSGQSAYYQAHSSNPWSYFWIGLGGSKAAALLERVGFTESSPVLHDKGKAWKSYFEEIYESYFLNGDFGLDCLGKAYLLLSEMSQVHRDNATPVAIEKGHIQAAKAYIRNNFQFPISILDVAHSVGVSPNYLANLFAKQGEISPKRYLTQVRMEVSAKLLRSSSSSISDISRAVGYSSPLHFSKAFAAYYGASPLHYRNQGGQLK